MQTDVTAACVAAYPHTHTSLARVHYENPKHEPTRDYDYDYDEDFLEEDAKKFSRNNVGIVVSIHLMPFVYKRRSLLKHYGIHKERDIYKLPMPPW